MVWQTKCDLSSPDSAQFNYCASGSAALAFSILFFLVFIAHISQAIMFRSKYCWVICMGVLWEVVAFVLRAYATVDQTKRTTMIPAQIFVLLAPIWLNAFIYMVFGRMVYFYLADQKIAGIAASRMALFFVWLDIISFLVQATGGTMASQDDNKTIQLGFKVYTGGVGMQQFFILCFIGLAITFHLRMSRGEGISERGRQWIPLIYVMYASLTFITIRVIYRLVEFIGELSQTDFTLPHGDLVTKEVYFYVLEGVPMVCAYLAWNIFHPGRVLIGPESEFPKKPSRRERSDERRRQKREKFEMKQAAKPNGESEDYHYPFIPPSHASHETVPHDDRDGFYDSQNVTLNSEAHNPV